MGGSPRRRRGSRNRTSSSGSRSGAACEASTCKTSSKSNSRRRSDELGARLVAGGHGLDIPGQAEAGRLCPRTPTAFGPAWSLPEAVACFCNHHLLPHSHAPPRNLRRSTPTAPQAHLHAISDATDVNHLLAALLRDERVRSAACIPWACRIIADGQPVRVSDDGGEAGACSKVRLGMARRDVRTHTESTALHLCCGAT